MARESLAAFGRRFDVIHRDGKVPTILGSYSDRFGFFYSTELEKCFRGGHLLQIVSSS